MRRIYLISLLLISLLTAPLSFSYAQQKSAARTSPKSSAASGLSIGNADYITAAMLKDYLYFIASDEMEGRDTPSRGLNTTAKFIGMNLSRWGFKPMGDDGNYYQHIALRRSRTDPADCRAEMAGQQFVFGDDFLARTNGTPTARWYLLVTGWQSPKRTITRSPGSMSQARLWSLSS